MPTHTLARPLSRLLMVPHTFVPTQRPCQLWSSCLAAGSASPGPKLILGGRALLDDTQPLSACSLTPASKVLVLAGRSAPQVAAVHDQGDRAARIDRLKAAATAMASRSEEYVPAHKHLRNAHPFHWLPLG